LNSADASPHVDRSNLRTIGVVVGAHGLKGTLSVAPLSDFPERFAALKSVYLARDEVVLLKGTAKRVYWVSGQVNITLHEVTSRSAAEVFKGAELCVVEADAWPLPADTYFAADLIGFRGVDERGSVIGTLVDASKGAQDVLEFECPGREALLVPFVQQWVGRVDVQAKTIELLNWRLLAEPEAVESSPQDDH
jgi:16S rRNA processing protein RimM